MSLISMHGIISTTTKIKLDWTDASSPGFGATFLRAVGHDGTYWVACGQSGKIRYATNPAGSWTSAAAPNFGAQDIIALHIGSDGYWVASSTAGSARLTTNPTGTWNVASVGLGGNLFSSYYGAGPRWVIASANDLSYATLPTEVPWTSNVNFMTNTTFSLSSSPTHWLATGLNGEIRVTTNPAAAWTSVANPFVAGETVRSGHYGGDGNWVVVGENAKMITTKNPTSAWTLNTSLPLVTADEIMRVWWGNGLWMAFTSTKKVISAIDPTGTWFLNTFPTDVGLNNISSGSDGNWVIVCASGKIRVGS